MIKNLVLTLLISFSFLLIATKSSPMYVTNDWVDANATFTCGKSIANGKVPYKDIFDQKGPLLLFIHAFASVISSKSFFGVFLMETLAFAIFLFFCWKIFELFLDKNLALSATILTAFLIVFHTAFTHGNSKEEYVLPFLSISLYYLLKHLKNHIQTPIPNRIIILHGILAGCVIWIKYSMLGFWLGLVLSYGLMFIMARQYYYVFKFGILFLFGVLIATIPWVVYFGIHGALQEFIEVYFLTNINHYAESEGILMNLVITVRKMLSINIKNNTVFSVFYITGIISFLFTKAFFDSYRSRLLVLIPFLFLFLSVYGGGKNYIYYFQIFSPLVLFGVIYLFNKLISIGFGNRRTINLIPYVGMLVLWMMMYFFHHNAYFLKYDKDDLFQYKFADYINQFDNASLLNYGALDVGLYHAAGIEPTTYFIMEHNFIYERYPNNLDSLNGYIANRSTDFVVVRNKGNTAYKNSLIEENYRKVLSQNQSFEGQDFTYILYQKR